MSNPLIDPNSLRSRLGTVAVHDLRWRLGDPGHGRSSYVQGHIPGAIFVDLDADLSGPPGPGGRHPLPDPERFRMTLENLGISPATDVVVYDDANGMVAARMWWMLKAIGHPAAVLVLDGGFPAWEREGLQVESGAVEPTPARYPGPIAFTGVVDIDDLEGRVLIDVRSAERYEGAVEPVDPKPGHIPGALSYPATKNLEEGHFADPEALRRLYGKLDDPVLSCGSGVTACHSALAMVTAGLPRPDVFIGSYSQWSSSDRPVATGPDPR